MVQIPVRAAASDSTQIAMCKNKLPVAANARARKDGQRRRRNCRGDCRDSRTSYPRRNDHRCAGRRGSTAPVNERLHTPLTDSPHALPVRANRAACEKFSQLKQVNKTSMERTALELQLCETAVYASLAPAQPPPPPAGLASSPLVQCTPFDRITMCCTVLLSICCFARGVERLGATRRA